MVKQHVKVIDYATYKLGAQLEIIEVDDKFFELTGYTFDDVKELGLTQIDLIFDEDRDEYLKAIDEGVSRDGEAFLEHRIKRKDGTERYVFCLGKQETDSEGNITSIIRVSDMTKMISMRIQAEKIRKENETELESWIEAASRDDLTGAFRRGAFLRKLKEVESFKNTAAVMLDMDDFKNINDTCGHAVGDRVLAGLCDALRSVLRNDDLICRMGGDEFAIFMKNVGNEEIAAQIAKRILAEVDKLSGITEEKVPVHISIGMKLMTEEIKLAEFPKLYRAADEALYAAKEQGKNRFVISK